MISAIRKKSNASKNGKKRVTFAPNIAISREQLLSTNKCEDYDDWEFNSKLMKAREEATFDTAGGEGKRISVTPVHDADSGYWFDKDYVSAVIQSNPDKIDDIMDRMAEEVLGEVDMSGESIQILIQRAMNAA
jgi:hypothetical protein